MEASAGRIDLEEDSDPAERDECTDDYTRRALELERWTVAQPIFGVLFGPDGTLAWIERPALLDGVDTLADLATRAEGLPALGER